MVMKTKEVKVVAADLVLIFLCQMQVIGDCVWEQCCVSARSAL